MALKYQFDFKYSPIVFRLTDIFSASTGFVYLQ